VARARLLGAGIKFVYEEPQRASGKIWQPSSPRTATCTRSLAMTSRSSQTKTPACRRRFPRTSGPSQQPSEVRCPRPRPRWP
jgi:hypothetical protein